MIFGKSNKRASHAIDGPPLAPRIILTPFLLGCVGGCAPIGSNDLEKLGTVRASIGGEPFELWVADEPLEIQRGLMFVTAEKMAPLPDGTRRGMLFVFPTAQRQSATMRNVSIPLDIAYLDEEGVVATLFTMEPFDDRPGQYASGVPISFAVEVNAGVLSTLGVEVGEVMLQEWQMANEE